MGLLNQVFQGNPNTLGVVAAGGEPNAPNVGVDTVNGAFYISSGNGWTPAADVVEKTILTGQGNSVSSLLSYTTPVAGLYRVDTYTVQATAANGTLPVPTVHFTEADLATTSTVTTVASGANTTGEGQSQSGFALANAAANSAITVSVGAPTTLTYNIKARIEFLG